MDSLKESTQKSATSTDNSGSLIKIRRNKLGIVNVTNSGVDLLIRCNVSSINRLLNSTFLLNVRLTIKMCDYVKRIEQVPSSFKLAYLQSYEQRRNAFNSSLILDRDLLIVGLKIVLTLSVDPKHLNYPSHDWWTTVVLFSAPDLCTQVACNIAYLIVGIGYSPKIIADCLRYLHDYENWESKIIRKVLKAYNARPLSLLQSSRKAVRKCMRDGHVLEDCYNYRYLHQCRII